MGTNVHADSQRTSEPCTAIYGRAAKVQKTYSRYGCVNFI